MESASAAVAVTVIRWPRAGVVSEAATLKASAVIARTCWEASVPSVARTTER